jgi:hypothetical protein
LLFLRFDDDTREDFANASEHAALLAEAGVLQKLVALLHGDVASAEAAATIAKLLVRNEYCKKVIITNVIAAAVDVHDVFIICPWHAIRSLRLHQLLELNVLDALQRVATGSFAPKSSAIQTITTTTPYHHPRPLMP